VKQVTAWAVHLDLKRFATLTLDPKRIPSGTEPHAYLQECWARFRTIIKDHDKACERRTGYARRAWSYIAVVEHHKPRVDPESGDVTPGLPHLHVLGDRYIADSWLRWAWVQSGGGIAVDIRYRDAQMIANYVAKYVGKQHGSADPTLYVDMPKGVRRYKTSRSVRLSEDPVEGPKLRAMMEDGSPRYELLEVMVMPESLSPEDLAAPWRDDVTARRCMGGVDRLVWSRPVAELAKQRRHLKSVAYKLGRVDRALLQRARELNMTLDIDDQGIAYDPPMPVGDGGGVPCPELRMELG
jgi:hypothetical protein